MSDYTDLHDLLLDLNALDDSMREQAYAALLSIGAEAVPDLLDSFSRIAGPARLLAIRAMGEIGDPRAVPLLLDLMESDDPEEYVYVSSLAAKSLRQIGDDTAVRGLVDHLSHPRSGPRRMAATVLGNIGSPLAVPGLIAALRDVDQITRTRAVRALEQIGTPQAIAAVAVWRDGQD
jgi:HEAT repeat protein